ncbi:MAG: hypothetical protein GX038_06305 [Erysipelothrix sp.]|nr:hypothetical protein [Erysipelothrix sp.]
MRIVRKVALVCAFVLLFTLSSEFLVRKRMNLVDVIVVKNNLSQRHLIKEDDIKVLKTSKHLVPDDAIYDRKDIVGKYVKMEHTLLKEQMIRTSNIESLDESIDAPNLLLYENQRVYALKKDVVGTAGASLQRGSYVDVAVQKKKDEEYGIIIENVRVVGVKDRYGEEVKQGTVPHVILLAVDVGDINSILKAEEEAKIVLLPRNVSHES